MLCFGWYCVERARGELLQPGGNRRLRRAGKSGKSGAKCGCNFLAVSRVAESATQPQLIPASPATLSLVFLSHFVSPPILIDQSPYSPLNCTAAGPYHPLCRTLLVGVT